MTRLVLLCVAALLTACAPTAGLGKRHEASNLPTPLPLPDFDAYVLAARQYIAAANQIAENPLPDAVIADRGPFELAPDGRRCRTDGKPAHAALLIHDLGGTPYVMRDLGARLARACYLVRAILLPGHGGVPGDLLNVDDRDWQQAVRLGVASLAGAADEVTLVGFGLGGSLALDYVLSDRPEPIPVTSLVLLAPAMPAPASGFEVEAQRFYRAIAPSSGWHMPGSGIAWPEVFADDDPVRYESLPSNARLQEQGLVLDLARQESALDLPVFVAISEDDVAVDADAAQQWFCTSVSGRREMLWYTATPDAPVGCDFVTARSSASVAALDLSHTGLPVDPDNPRYGRDSGYRDCLHYVWERDTPSWFFCSDPAKTTENSEVRYGEITHANLEAHVMRRLTYNPDFDGLATELVGFLDGAR